jgi:putative methylase
LGGIVQKRIVRKLDLERLLSKVEAHPSPRADLEQYTISAQVAATMLHFAAYSNSDIIGKTVLDLGCGTGRLALGAAFLGAKQVAGVDVDRSAIRAAVKNSVSVGLTGRVDWVVADIAAVTGEFDTVLQNPPFGVQKRGADRAFLEKALDCGKAVYSLHVHSEKDALPVEKLRAGDVLPVAPSSFLERFVEAHSGRVRAVYAMVMVIPRMFGFHEEKRHESMVDLYVIEKS